MKSEKKAPKDTFPCALCKQELARRTDKKGKPYFVCDECGTQFFIRYRSGIAKLEALMQAPDAKRSGLKLPAPIALAVTKELDLLDDASEIVSEAEEIGESDSGEEALPVAEWIEARTARVRSLLNLK